MIDEILPIPQIPEALRIASRRGVLIPFVGAGVSRLAGCPDWNEFADGALKFFIGKGKFSHSQYEQIRHLNPRVKLSVALSLETEHKLPIDFRNLLHPKNNPSQGLGERLYSHLSKLAKTFVTTNYDEWLDQGIAFPELSPSGSGSISATAIRSPRVAVHRIADLTHSNLNLPDTVIHLHGSLADPSGMILTTRHYVRHYANDRDAGRAGEENRVLTFLENLFREKNVVFLGYGLGELEILEYIVLKARSSVPAGNEEPRHFIVQGFFSHERELMRSLRDYYLSDCGIELIPYLRDNKDWHQLVDVLEHLARELPARPPLASQEFLEMDDLLNG